MSKEIEFNFNLHIPYALKNFTIFDIGCDSNLDYFDENKTCEILNNFSELSYLKVNKILYDLIRISRKKFNFTITMSGISIEIMKKFSPSLLESFEKLIKTNQVKIRSSYYNSISVPITSKREILEQIEMHQKIVEETFNVMPVGFLNNSNSIKFNEFSLKSEDYVKKIEKLEISKIKFNYENFGIENLDDSGIFNFLKHLPNEFLKSDFKFITNNSLEEFNLIHENKFLIKNKLQESLMGEILDLENLIKNSNNSKMISDWRKISNPHLLNDLDFNNFNNNLKNEFMHFNNHYDVYVNIKNIVEDMKLNLSKKSNDNSIENLSNLKLDIF